MMIKTIKVGELRTNCYIVASDKTREAIIIDPGDEGEKIIREIEKYGLRPLLIVNTHIHPDHVCANETLIEKFGIHAAAGQSEQELTEKWGSHFKYFSMLDIRTLGIKRLLSDGDTVSAGDLEFRVIKTPGHAESSICLYSGPSNEQGSGILFSGDTLFAGDHGRTDLPGASQEDMEISLSRLMELPENTKVYPGHGNTTTIKQEKGIYAAG